MNLLTITIPFEEESDALSLLETILEDAQEGGLASLRRYWRQEAKATITRGFLSDENLNLIGQEFDRGTVNEKLAFMRKLLCAAMSCHLPAWEGGEAVNENVAFMLGYFAASFARNTSKEALISQLRQGWDRNKEHDRILREEASKRL